MSRSVDGRDLLADMLDSDTTFQAQPVRGPSLEFILTRAVLAPLLERVHPIVPTRDPMEVLKNFQLDARPGRLRVIATDTELSMIATTDQVQVTTPGTAVIAARKLMDICREAADGEIHVRITNGTARITIGRTTWTQQLPGGEDYPLLPEITDTVLVNVERAVFVAALQTVRYAARDATRAALALINVRGGRAIASDGARFQQATLGEATLDFRLKIAAVDALVKLTTKLETPQIGIGQSEHHLIFHLGSDVLIVNKPVIQVPDMEATLLRPALANRRLLTVERAELLSAVKRVRINADPDTSAISLRLSTGQLTVTSRDKFANEAVDTIPATWAGGERTIVLNHAHLADMISPVAGPTLHFALGEDTKTRRTPVLLRDPTTGSIGVLQQMHGDWVGQ